MIHFYHIRSWYALSDTYHQIQARADRFNDRTGGKFWRHKDNRCIRIFMLDSLTDCVKYGYAQRFLAAFSWCYPGDDICTIIDHLLAMKSALCTGDALDDQPCITAY